MVASSHLLKNALYSRYFVYDFKHSAFFRRICTALSAWNNFWRLMKRKLPLYYSHVWLKSAMILAVQLTVWMCLVVISGREVGERRLLFPRRVFSIRWRRLWSDVKYSHTTGKPMMASKPVRYVFTLQPPTDVQFGNYAAGLQEHLHDVIGNHERGFSGFAFVICKFMILNYGLGG